MLLVNFFYAIIFLLTFCFEDSIALVLVCKAILKSHYLPKSRASSLRSIYECSESVSIWNCNYSRSQHKVLQWDTKLNSPYHLSRSLCSKHIVLHYKTMHFKYIIFGHALDRFKEIMCKKKRINETSLSKSNWNYLIFYTNTI